MSISTHTILEITKKIHALFLFSLFLKQILIWKI